MRLTVKTWSDNKIEVVLPEVKPTKEACLKLLPYMAQYNDIYPLDGPKAKITPIQMSKMLQDLGLFAPVPGWSWNWYTGEDEYMCPPSDKYFEFYRKYLGDPVTALDWRTASWVCRDEALKVMERSREWLIHIAVTIASCYPAPNYIKNFPWGHAFNLAFLTNKEGKIEVWFVDSTWEMISNFSTNSERYGIYNLSGVLL